MAEYTRVVGLVLALACMTSGCADEGDEPFEPETETLGEAHSAITLAPELAPCDASWVHPTVAAGNYMLVTDNAGSVIDYQRYKPSAIGVVHHDLATGLTYEVVADADFNALTAPNPPSCQDAALLPPVGPWAPGAGIGAPLPMASPVPPPTPMMISFGATSAKTAYVMGWVGTTLSSAAWGTAFRGAPVPSSYHTSFCANGFSTGWWLYDYGAVTNPYGWEMWDAGGSGAATPMPGAKSYLASDTIVFSGWTYAINRAALIQPDRIVRSYSYAGDVCEP